MYIYMCIHIHIQSWLLRHLVSAHKNQYRMHACRHDREYPDSACPRSQKRIYYIYIYKYIYVYICIYIYIFTYTYIYIHIQSGLLRHFIRSTACTRAATTRCPIGPVHGPKNEFTVYMYTNTYDMCVHIYIYIYMCTYVCLHIHIFMYICTYIHMQSGLLRQSIRSTACTRAATTRCLIGPVRSPKKKSLYTCIQIHTCVHIYAYIYMCTYVYLYIYLCIYLYTHTYAELTFEAFHTQHRMHACGHDEVFGLGLSAKSPMAITCTVSLDAREKTAGLLADMVTGERESVCVWECE